MIYLDNSATTKPHPDVLESFNYISETFFANPSSIHQLGGKAEQLLEKAREQAATLLHVGKDELLFTSGGTEGNNIAIKGIALQHQARGKHIITTSIEHPSVTEACRGLEQLGFEITFLQANSEGRIDVERLRQAIRPDTILISIMHVNNEIGTIQDISAIGQIAKAHPKLFLHVDHVQGLGKVPLDFGDAGIDLCTMSGHKIHGLKGTGLLYRRRGVKIFPLFHGGGQEFGDRPGTENLAGIVSFVKALRLIKEDEQQRIDELCEMKNWVMNEISNIPGVLLNTPDHNAAPHIVHFSVPGIKPEVLIHMLGEEGIYISTKSACSSRSTSASQVLEACGFNEERASSGIRASMSYETTQDEVAQFLESLQRSIKKLKAFMR